MKRDEAERGNLGVRVLGSMLEKEQKISKSGRGNN